MINTMHYPSPVGRLLLAEKNGALIGLWIDGQKYFSRTINNEQTAENPDTAILKQAQNWLDRYFRRENPSPHELKLAPSGSEFRQTVWKLLCEIPSGKTTTYKELAQKIAAARRLEHMSAQAVGGAVGHNPISIIIPCHRVLGTDGSLTGYAGGIELKKKLLILEGVDLPRKT